MSRTLLLTGIVGSTAYGLARAGSDVDKIGIFATPPRELLGLAPPADSYVSNSPDIALHEALKFCRLALKCNPTATELLWLEPHGYETITRHGRNLIDIRTAFLSQNYVRNAYLGYATSQFHKLMLRGDGTFGPDLAKRTAKHARHMYRLLKQGLELWTDGHLTIRLDNPDEVHEFGERVANGDLHYADQLLRHFEILLDCRSTVLPDAPDRKAVESWLLEVRGV